MARRIAPRRHLSAPRLRAARERRGWTQLQLAEAAGLHVRTVSTYEQGHRSTPDADCLLALAEALRVHPADLTEPAAGNAATSKRLTSRPPTARKKA